MSYQDRIDDLNYYSDPRVTAGESNGLEFDESAMTLTWVIDNDEGEENIERVIFRAEFQVCGTCNGRGSHVNPSIDAGGLSREDFDDDPDFAEAYFSGGFDVTCNGCQGKRVVPVIDRGAADEAALKRYDAYLEDLAADRRERMAELRFGC